MNAKRRYECRVAAVAIVLMVTVALSRSAYGQTFNSGSDGSDGIYAPSGPPGTVVVFDPTRFTGSQVAARIFNFTQITIPAGVTVRIPATAINGPVYWLAQGDVVVQGTIDLSGGPGTP